MDPLFKLMKSKDTFVFLQTGSFFFSVLISFSLQHFSKPQKAKGSNL